MSEDQIDNEVVVELARETLKGDIRDFLLDRLKHDKSPLPWDAQPEHVQRSTIEAATTAAARLIEEVARVVIAEGKEVVHVALEQVVVKDGIKAVVSCPKTGAALAHLAEAQGSTVAIVFASTEHVQGQRKLRSAKPDQASLLDQEGEVPPPPPTADEPPGTVGGAQMEGDDDTPPSEEPKDGPKDEPEVARAKKRGKKTD